jgi:hypothetical protein
MFPHVTAVPVVPVLQEVAGLILLLLPVRIVVVMGELVVVVVATVHAVMATGMNTGSAVPAGTTTRTVVDTDRHLAGRLPWTTIRLRVAATRNPTVAITRRSIRMLMAVRTNAPTSVHRRRGTSCLRAIRDTPEKQDTPGTMTVATSKRSCSADAFSRDWPKKGTTRSRP